MGRMTVLAAATFFGLAGNAADFAFEGGLDLVVDGTPWLRTVTTPFDESRTEETYKVYTHIYDFDGNAPITKGHGGKYSHHRGMFIGWRDTQVGADHYDTWHMKQCSQRHVTWVELDTSGQAASQASEIHWCDETGEAFIKEIRRITARPGENGLRVFDFQSTLTSLKGTIPLRGDLQHAGMQVRMDNEVSEHEGSTQYILPSGAEELDDDKVVGAWWVCCSPVVRDKRYWILHMTPSNHPTGEPVYSIRRYARFGAFFEPDLEEGKPLELNFRIVVSEKELTREVCETLYREYIQSAG